MKKLFFGFLIGVVAIAGIFGIAGSYAWWNAWVLILLVTLVGILTSHRIKQASGLAQERETAVTKAMPWDAKIVRLLNVMLPLMLFGAALDKRFHWFQSIPNIMSVVAFLLIVLALLLTYLAIAANPFFSSHIRIQKERGHTTVSSGPYRWIRHPGYTGALIFNLSVPVALGAWLPISLGIVTALILIYRTVKEDEILVKELDGYHLYTKDVRYRLVPGIW